jgi:8-oxo-dGTP diphosphatase
MPGEPDTSEGAFLDAYDPTVFPPVALTVDVVLLTIRQGRLSVLLVQRAAHPHMGQWALPGGFVQPDEDLDGTARRTLLDETGLDAFPGHLEQLRSYGDPDRDPRMRVVTVAYLGLMPDLGTPQAGGETTAARFWPVADVLGWRDDRGREPAERLALAFDHARILDDAIERARNKLEYTSLATAFVEEPFTLSELRRVYETVWDAALDHANFRRKVLATDGFVVPTGETTPTGRARADLYRRGPVAVLQPPMLREPVGRGTRR